MYPDVQLYIDGAWTDAAAVVSVASTATLRNGA